LSIGPPRPKELTLGFLGHAGARQVVRIDMLLDADADEVA
jgi:hypothetical protein